MAIPKRKPQINPAIKFAESVVDTACILDEEVAGTVLRAFASVPRHKFISEGFARRAYEDTALPIGYGQIISKPSTVARMLGLIGIRPGMRILDVGCGSGYCSAVMSAAGAQVYAIEYVGLLAQKTRKLLDGLGHHKVLVKNGDGRRGWSEFAPFDAIVVSAVFPSIEPELLSQLKNPDGRLVAPIGNDRGQIMSLWEAKGGGVTMYQLEPCSLVGAQG